MTCCVLRMTPCVALAVLAATATTACDQPPTQRALARTRATDTTKPPAPPERDPNTVVVEGDQLRAMKLEPVETRPFRTVKAATGRIAFNEDTTTPVFTPFTGRVISLHARPGDEVRRGALLFEIDTPDLVQVESDLIAAGAAAVKAKNQMELATRVAARQKDLYDAEAASQKDLEQAQADLRNAQSDLRGAEGTRAAVRDRLRIFGKGDEDIARVERTHRIDRVSQVSAPIGGTVTGRKVGPGQFVKPDNPDPLFTIADLSTMWLLANVYETDIPSIRVGQALEVRVLAYPNEIFRARVSYIAAAADPATHRVAVRAEVTNRGQKLKPEMLASFAIVTGEETRVPTVPATALVRDGEAASVWVAAGPNRFARRVVEVGAEQGGAVQILSGVKAGERVA
jgi:membrane fusion protein, heavy metal efflux system